MNTEFGEALDAVFASRSEWQEKAVALEAERDKLKAQRDALLAAAKKTLPIIESYLRGRRLYEEEQHSAIEVTEMMRQLIEEAEKT